MILNGVSGAERNPDFHFLGRRQAKIGHFAQLRMLSTIGYVDGIGNQAR
jgi:hypothetical protein